MKFWFKKLIYISAISINLHASELQEQKPVVVSLGWDCEVALRLRETNLRHEALPFDWIRSYNYKSILKIIHDKFSRFLDKQFLLADGGDVKNRFYKISFVHDFPTKEHPELTGCEEAGIDHVGTQVHANFLAAYENVKEKYDRRIARLTSILNGEREVVFIRTHTKPQQARAIVHFFEKYFPKLKFKLIIVHRYNYHKNEWSINKVQNYYLNSLDKTYGFLNWFAAEDWHKIFIKLDLISATQ